MEDIRTIDYYSLYCDFADTDFIESFSAKLSEIETHLIKQLLKQADENNRVYIPNLVLEGLVDEMNTPYLALRNLYALREKRVIFYDLLEEDITETHGNIVDDIQASTRRIQNRREHAEQIIIAQKEATATGEDVAIEIDEEPPESLGTYMKRNKKFIRYATLNIEYPVIYFCLKEESVFHEQWDEGILNILYAAITGNNLGKALEQLNLSAVLEFLQYVQSIFGQPMTQVTVSEPQKRTIVVQPKTPEEIVEEDMRKWEEGEPDEEDTHT